MDWRFSIFLLTMFGLLLGFSWAGSDVGPCTLDIAQKATSGSDATTCVEFWLNRYQTLIGAFVALAAGIAAWRGAMLQVSYADKQFKVAARQTSISLVQMLNKELEPIRAVKFLVIRANDYNISLNFHRRKLIDGLKSMIDVADIDPIVLNQIYVKQFQTYIQSHTSSLQAATKIHTDMRENLSEAMLSGETKRAIQDYANMFQVALMNHADADAIFQGIINVFDESVPRHRVSFLRDSLSEISRQVVPPRFDDHPGYKIAILSASNIDALLDASLASVEGRSA